MAIIRGTTPTLTFRVKSNLDLSEIAALWITFRTMPGARQREKTFTLEDVSLDPDENLVVLELSQEDTLSFGEQMTQIQMRLRMNDDMAYASGIIETCIGRILKEGVI